MDFITKKYSSDGTPSEIKRVRNFQLIQNNKQAGIVLKGKHTWNDNTYSPLYTSQWQ